MNLPTNKVRFKQVKCETNELLERLMRKESADYAISMNFSELNAYHDQLVCIIIRRASLCL